MWDFEFYANRATGEAMYRRIGERETSVLTVESREVIEFLLRESEVFYPRQYAALCEAYDGERDVRYYDFYRARRMINCCFADRGCRPDLDEYGNYRFVSVRCPMIAECEYHKVICLPEFRAEPTDMELEVLHRFLYDQPEDRIADELSLPSEEVRCHRRNGLRRLKMTFGQFAEQAKRTNMFEAGDGGR